MSYNVGALDTLVEQFERIPGIGHKSAQRMAFYVLNMPEEDAKKFADSILGARQKIHHCKKCCNLTEDEYCSICSNEARDQTVVCVSRTRGTSTRSSAPTSSRARTMCCTAPSLP